MYRSSKSSVKLCDKFDRGYEVSCLYSSGAFTHLYRLMSSLPVSSWDQTSSCLSLRPSAPVSPVHASACPPPLPLRCLSQVQNSLSQTLQDPARREGRTHSVYCTTTKKPLHASSVTVDVASHLSPLSAVDVWQLFPGDARGDLLKRWRATTPPNKDSDVFPPEHTALLSCQTNKNFQSDREKIKSSHSKNVFLCGI